MRKLIVAGNWKMNASKINTDTLIKDIIFGLDANTKVSVIVCPPYPYFSQVADGIKNSIVKLGSQDVNSNANGAFTGEVSTNMLVDFGVEYAIIGHSERRALYGETDAIVISKIIAAQQAKLTPILCVGESLEDREAGLTQSVIAKQLNAVIDALGIDVFNNIIIAYEPIWAIGTGKTASPEQAQSVHKFIRDLLADNNKTIAQNTAILYGGSVNGKNSSQLFACNDIDGGLVGGASLNAADFLQICRG